MSEPARSMINIHLRSISAQKLTRQKLDFSELSPIMSSILAAISECLMGGSTPTHNSIVTITEKSPSQSSPKRSRSDQDIANDILTLLFNASKNDPNLDFKIQAEVSTSGWQQGLAERVFNGLQNALTKGASMGEAMKISFERSISEAYEFSSDHPVYFAIIALGILVLLAPWALEALGFAELGPVEGES